MKNFWLELLEDGLANDLMVFDDLIDDEQISVKVQDGRIFCKSDSEDFILEATDKQKAADWLKNKIDDKNIYFTTENSAVIEKRLSAVSKRIFKQNKEVYRELSNK